MTSSQPEEQLPARSHPRQQIVLAVLAAALVGSTIMMWMLVSAIRESNDLQRQLLVAQQAEPAAKPAVKRRAGSSAASRLNTEPRDSAIGRDRRRQEQATSEGDLSTQVATGNVHLARHGRQ